MTSPTLERPAPRIDQREARFIRYVESRLHDHYRLASVILGDETDAQDAVQDAMEQAWRGWGALRDPDRFDAWVARMVINECRDRLRRRRRRPVTDISDLMAATLAAPDALRDSVERDAIGRAFNVLNPDQRIAVALRFYADLTVDQIADRVGAPAGTIKSRLHHALELLQAELASAMRGDE
jgi:RNA polymerase sigma factor (sigma-70 family)